MNPINIIKTACRENSSIEIIYKGNIDKDVDLEKAQKLLNDFVNTKKHSNMIENISIIKTILRDIDEDLLTVFYQDKECSVLVKYSNNKLLFYEKKCKRYIINYDLNNGLNLDYYNFGIDIGEYNNLEIFSEEINEIMEQIYYLKNIKVRSLDIDSKILIQIYKLFFDENPDFSSKDINLKIQAMLSILAEFGITLGIDYDFKRNKNNIPFSCEIKDLVDELYPFGEIDTIKDNIELDSESIKIIKIVGKYIRETISNTQNPICFLQNISKAIYVVKYCVFSNDDIYELAKITNCDSSEVMECFKLKRIIEENIYKK